MKYERLGNTELVVSELGFGAWAIGGNAFGNSYGPTDDAVSVAAVHQALASGCTFFDTADVYGHGHSETLLGQALRQAGKLGDVVIASKVGADFGGEHVVPDFSPRHIRRAIGATLRRLGRDYLDLYQLHNPPASVVRDGAAFEALEALAAAGTIRHYGVSIGTVDEGRACLESGKPQTLQLVYNALSLVDARPVAAPLFSAAAERGVGLIAREPLANGALAGGHGADREYGTGDNRLHWSAARRQRYAALAESLRAFAPPGATLAQTALRFVLDEPAIATCVVGVKTPEQARENFAAADLPPLGERGAASSA